MKKILFTSLLFFAFQIVFSQETKTTEAPKIKWHSMKEATQLCSKKPKKLFIDVYTDWCGWCKVLDSKTFTDPWIIKYVNANFYAVKFNAEGSDTLGFDGKSYANPYPGVKRSMHTLTFVLLKGQQQIGYPSMSFVDEKMKVIKSFAGFQKPYQLEPILKYIATNAYQKMEYDAYLQNFKGELQDESVPQNK
ncbi:MAG: DUF255 domain-containing protein [Bacteroidota bacterium]